MSAGLIWAIILGLIGTIGLVSLIPLWIVIRFPDRASRDTLPAYMRRADVPVLPRQREASEPGGVREKTSA